MRKKATSAKQLIPCMEIQAEIKQWSVQQLCCSSEATGLLHTSVYKCEAEICIEYCWCFSWLVGLLDGLVISCSV